MENVNPTPQTFEITSYRDKRKTYLTSGQVTQKPESERFGGEARTDILQKLSEIKSNLYPQGHPRLNQFKEPLTIRNEDPAGRKLGDIITNEQASPLNLDKIFRRDPNFNIETYSNKVDSLRGTQTAFYNPQTDPSSRTVGQWENNNLNNPNAAAEHSPEREIQETRQEVEKIREDVEDIKQKIGMSSHPRPLNANVNNFTPIKDESSFVSPSQSKTRMNRALNPVPSPLAASLDENITAIKKDLATILNNTKQFVNPLTSSNYKSPGSTIGYPEGGSHFRFPINQSLSPSTIDNQFKPSFYSSIVNTSQVRDPQAEREQRTMIPAPENQSKNLPQSKTPDRITGDQAAGDEPIDDLGGSSLKQQTYSPGNKSHIVIQATDWDKPNPILKNEAQGRGRQEIPTRGRQEPPDLSKNLNRARSSSQSRGLNTSHTGSVTLGPETDRPRLEKLPQQAQRDEISQKSFDRSDRLSEQFQRSLSPENRQGIEFVKAVHKQYLEYQRSQAQRGNNLEERPFLDPHDSQDGRSPMNNSQKTGDFRSQSLQSIQNPSVVDRTKLNERPKEAGPTSTQYSPLQKKPSDPQTLSATKEIPRDSSNIQPHTQNASSHKEPIREQPPETGRVDDVYSFRNGPINQRNVNQPTAQSQAICNQTLLAKFPYIDFFWLIDEERMSLNERPNLDQGGVFKEYNKKSTGTPPQSIELPTNSQVSWTLYSPLQ